MTVFMWLDPLGQRRQFFFCFINFHKSIAFFQNVQVIFRILFLMPSLMNFSAQLYPPLPPCRLKTCFHPYSALLGGSSIVNLRWSRSLIPIFSDISSVTTQSLLLLCSSCTAIRPFLPHNIFVDGEIYRSKEVKNGPFNTFPLKQKQQ